MDNRLSEAVENLSGARAIGIRNYERSVQQVHPVAKLNEILLQFAISNHFLRPSVHMDLGAKHAVACRSVRLSRECESQGIGVQPILRRSSAAFHD